MKLKLKLKNSYGPTAYPDCPKSELILKLTRQKGLYANHIVILEDLGFEIEYSKDGNLSMLAPLTAQIKKIRDERIKQVEKSY